MDEIIISKEEEDTIFSQFPPEAFKEFKKLSAFGGQYKDGIWRQLLPYDVIYMIKAHSEGLSYAAWIDKEIRLGNIIPT